MTNLHLGDCFAPSGQIGTHSWRKLPPHPTSRTTAKDLATRTKAPSPGFVKIIIGVGVATLLVCWVKIQSVRANSTSPIRAAEWPTQLQGTVDLAGSEKPDSNSYDQSSTQPDVPSPSGVQPVPPLGGDDALLFRMIPLPSEANLGDAATVQAHLTTYQVPRSYAAELNTLLSGVNNASNNLAQTQRRIRSLLQVFNKDKYDYLQKVKEVNEGVENQSSVATKKLLDMQALYLERKHQYEQELASLQIFLQDPLPLMDQKLARRQEAAARYKSDIHELEQAISAIQTQIYASKETRQRLIGQLDNAYQEASQSALQAVSNASLVAKEENRLLGTIIRDYNDTLQRYGTSVQ